MANPLFFRQIDYPLLDLGTVFSNYFDVSENPFVGSILLEAVDFDNDGVDELVIHLFQGVTTTGIETDAPSPNVLLVLTKNAQDQWVLDEEKLYNLGLPPVELAGWVRQWAIGDLTGDGKPDMAFATNREDGRSQTNVLSNAANPELLLSDPRSLGIDDHGKYSTIEFILPNWNHAVGLAPVTSFHPGIAIFSGYARLPLALTFSDVLGYEELNLPLGGGTLEYLSHLSNSQNEKAYFFTDSKIDGVDGFPTLLMRDVDSDGLGNWTAIHAGTPFDLRDQIVVQETGWTGSTSQRAYYRYQNDYIAMSTYTDAQEIRLHPEQDPVIIAKYSTSRLKDPSKSTAIDGIDTEGAQFLHFFAVTANDIDQVTNISIQGELTRDNSNFIEVLDFNNDGFDDIINYSYELSGFPVVYLNNQMGGFSRANLDVLFPYSPLDGFRYTSKLISGSEPGLIDFIIFPGAGTNVPLFGTEAYNWFYFKGVAPIHSGPEFTNSAEYGAPGFNELYYRTAYSDVAVAIEEGRYANGLEFYLNEGKARGDLGFAPGSTVWGTDQLDTLDYGLHFVSDVAILDDAVLVGRMNGYTDTLINVERLAFTDTMLALDTAANENAGNAYLLYRAAFNRTPDVEGLGYWIAQMDNGANAVRDMAMNFILSNEFISLYGPNPSVTQFMDLIYENVLNRTPDAAGYAYWLDEFARDGDSTLYRAGILNNFAIGDENVRNVASQIADGIQYQAYVG